MHIKRISLVSSAALFTLTATASAGPLSIATSKVMAPPSLLAIGVMMSVTLGSLARAALAVRRQLRLQGCREVINGHSSCW